jgi:hypothetical protein
MGGRSVSITSGPSTNSLLDIGRSSVIVSDAVSVSTDLDGESLPGGLISTDSAAGGVVWPSGRRTLDAVSSSSAGGG